ncbi:hypothetical protein EYF80_027605 [Liparis tanakae]|uniref:Uncharacterized protein n=1 Tax=Liparis tanakae TaxID=230148 RepID=A0A4Z2HAD2_9TELE|nr:hypothetical protein EYF80_027605 [Liparis tanakae]
MNGGPDEDQMNGGPDEDQMNGGPDEDQMNGYRKTTTQPSSTFQRRRVETSNTFITKRSRSSLQTTWTSVWTEDLDGKSTMSFPVALFRSFDDLMRELGSGRAAPPPTETLTKLPTRVEQQVVLGHMMQSVLT